MCFGVIEVDFKESKPREDAITFRREDRFAPAIERTMRSYYQSLSEKDRRRYAGVEAAKLPHGGINYIAEVVGSDSRTVSKGIDELAVLESEGDPLEGREREEGAGRPKKR